MSNGVGLVARRSHGPVRVLVIDDSALVRKLLSEMLGADPGIEVVGTAGDPYIARQRIKRLAPDVLTLDVEMPRMDGLSFLRNLMRLHPVPVVMVSSLTARGADVTLDALALGAFDFVAKPGSDVPGGLLALGDELRDKVKAAAGTTPRPLPGLPSPSSRQATVATRWPASGLRSARHHLIALGASTGGTEALREILCALPEDAPGVVIAQHIPARFSTAFARRLDSLAAIRVAEACDGEIIRPGHAYVAPGDRHLRVRRSGVDYLCVLSDDLPVNRHRPSVDVLFESVAAAAGARARAALLTGMGSDGARGLLSLRHAGALTLAQDRASSVVWGMPGEAVRLGAASEVLPLSRIPAALAPGAPGRQRTATG